MIQKLTAWYPGGAGEVSFLFWDAANIEVQFRHLALTLALDSREQRAQDTVPRAIAR